MTENRMMNFKLRILIFFLYTLTIFSCVKVPRQENIYGVWKGESQGVELVFRFYEDETCEFSFKNKASGSIEILKGNLEIDFTKNPIPLTVRKIPKVNHPLHTILEFIKEDSIRIAHFSPRWRLRPISFDHNTTINLKKVDGHPAAR